MTRTLRTAALAAALALVAGAPARAQVGSIGASAVVDASDAPTLAVVSGERIDGAAFAARYGTLLIKAGLPDDVRLRHRVLSEMVGERLLVQEARAIGLPATAAYRREEALARRRLVLAYYAERALFEPITVTDAEREEAFARTRTTVTARHLYARTREAAEALRSRLARGERFETLAREVFADSALAASGGLLAPFSFDEMDAAFEDAAFTLPIGVVSAPVRTEQGYSVIRVERRDVLPIASGTDFARILDRLDAYVRTRKRQAARAAFLVRREAEMAPALHAAGMNALLRQSGAIARLDGASDVEVRTAVAATGDDARLPAITFRSGTRQVTWTAADVIRQAAFASDRTRARIATPADLAAVVRALALQQTLVDEAAARGYDREAPYSRAVAEAMDGYTVRTRRVALARPNAPEDSVRAAFARVEGDLVTPPRVDVSEIIVGDAALAARLRRDLDGGADFAALARAHSERPGAARSGGRLGWASDAELGALAGPLLAARDGETIGPMAVGGRYVIARVHAREMPRAMTWEEARPFLARIVGERIGNRAFEAHLSALRDRATIAFDADALVALPLYPSAPRPASSPAASR